MEDSSDHSHHHDNTWVETDSYHPDGYENKRRKTSKKDLIIRAVIVLFLVLLAMLLSWLKS